MAGALATRSPSTSRWARASGFSAGRGPARSQLVTSLIAGLLTSAFPSRPGSAPPPGLAALALEHRGDFADLGPQAEAAPIDEMQIKGTHNSYHKQPFVPLFRAHRYSQPTLYAQLAQHGVRGLELDLHRTRNGDFEVYHIALIDGRTHCRAFEDCLLQIRHWSDLDREHEPLFVWLELKDYSGGVPIRAPEEIDSVVRKVLGDRLITPDLVRDRFASLRERLSAEGWPSLAESRGRVMFVVLGNDEQRGRYTHGFRHLKRRAMFAAARPREFDQPWAAVAKLDDPATPEIERAQARRIFTGTNLCFATIADAECTRRRDQAMRAGFNVLLDDYVRPVPGRRYFLDLHFRHVARADAGDDATPPEPAPTRPVALD